MANIQYFLGANTPTGFYSLYHELLPLSRAEAIFILKGGPGCGKSTFLRHMADRGEAAGLECVRIPCSGDPDSLDAVIFPQRGIALADGTAPHVIEAEYPGVLEHYVNLGDCYDRAALAPLRPAVTEAFAAYKSHYKRAYRCLEAVGQLRRDDRELLLTDPLRTRLEKRAQGIIHREIRRGGGQTGAVAHRFLSATTHRGQIFLRETVTAQAKRIYELSDCCGLSHELLLPILTAASAAGWDSVACPDPMDPQHLAHLIIPGLSLAFVTGDPSDSPSPRPYRRLRLDAMTDRELYRSNRPRLRFSRKVSAALESEAVSALAQAKAAHDRLEALYNPHVDFQRVRCMAEELADSLFPAAPAE